MSTIYTLTANDAALLEFWTANSGANRAILLEALAADTTTTIIQQFTAATLAATVPQSATALGLETDTGKIYKASGLSAGNWTIIPFALARTDASVSYAASITTNANTVGFEAVLRMTLAGNLTINAPSNGSAGQRIRYHITCDGSNRTLALTGFTLPEGATYDGAMTSGKVRVIEIEKNGSAWFVTKNLQF